MERPAVKLLRDLPQPLLRSAPAAWIGWWNAPGRPQLGAVSIDPALPQHYIGMERPRRARGFSDFI